MTDLERLNLDDEYFAVRACVVHAGNMHKRARGTLGQSSWGRELSRWVAKLNEVAYRRNLALGA